MLSLSRQHIINSLLDKHHFKRAKPYHIAISQLIAKQLSKTKSSIVDTNNCLNEVFPSFDSLNKKLSLGFHLVDFFSNFFFSDSKPKDPKSLTA